MDSIESRMKEILATLTVKEKVALYELLQSLTQNPQPSAYQQEKDSGQE